MACDTLSCTLQWNEAILVSKIGNLKKWNKCRAQFSHWLKKILFAPVISLNYQKQNIAL